MQDYPVCCEQAGESGLAVGRSGNSERGSLASGTVDHDGVENDMDHEDARTQGDPPTMAPILYQSNGTTGVHVTSHD